MDRIYLDYAATTPIDPAVLMAMHAAEKKYYANASSIHSLGQISKDRIETARKIIASSLDAKPQEIVFTSGGTESNNLALIGSVLANKTKGNHIITTTIEHPSVLETCKNLSQKNIEIDYLDVDENGKINLNQLNKFLRSETVLVSVMMVNNETGCILPIYEIGEMLKDKGIIFHTDATQAYGKLDISIEKLNADLVSLSAHKIYGPKGIGCLYIRKGINIENIFFGGSQEGNRRPGTENIISIIGFTEAVEQLVVQRCERKSIGDLRDKFEAELKAKIPQIQINGRETPRVYSHSNIYFPFISGDSMLMKLDLLGIAVSIGSACSSGYPVPSHVLAAMDFKEKRILNSIRFSLGRFTSESEIQRVVDAICDIYKKYIDRMIRNDV